MVFKLEPEKQFPITTQGLAKILNAYGISEFTSEPITEGIENTSLVIKNGGKEHILRIYAEGKNPEHILFELKFQNLLRENNIPVPKVYLNQEGKPVTETISEERTWQSILMEKVEGQSVTTNPSRLLVAQLANLQARMHVLGTDFGKNTNEPKWIDLHDSLAPKIERVPVPSQGVIDFIERVKRYNYPLNPDLPHGYNHLDIDFDGNVLTKGDTVTGIIDFDDLQYSPIIVCLGFTLWNLLDDEGEEVVRYYLSEYEKIRPLNQLEREALPHVIFFRNYVMGIVRLLLWQEDTPVVDIENLLTLEKKIPVLTF